MKESTKRVNYRGIFSNDRVSFGEIQVYPLAKRYIENPKELENIWVYEDEFVKGVLHIEGERITELYVGSFFENQGIGGRLIQFAIKQKKCSYLWVLEKIQVLFVFMKDMDLRLQGQKN